MRTGYRHKIWKQDIDIRYGNRISTSDMGIGYRHKIWKQDIDTRDGNRKST